MRVFGGSHRRRGQRAAPDGAQKIQNAVSRLTWICQDCQVPVLHAGHYEAAGGYIARRIELDRAARHAGERARRLKTA
jgi:hypothetical protein